MLTLQVPRLLLRLLQPPACILLCLPRPQKLLRVGRGRLGPLALVRVCCIAQRLVCRPHLALQVLHAA